MGLLLEPEGKWPKRVLEWEVPGDRSATGLEVIPADLGRELYEALEQLYEDSSAPSLEYVNDALARYEREVGS